MSQPHSIREVDLQFLARCLGVESWPDHAKVHNWHQGYALRVVTNAHRPYEPSGKIHADIVVRNTTAWVNRAHDHVLRTGIEMERERREPKIRELFDLRGATGQRKQPLNGQELPA